MNESSLSKYKLHYEQLPNDPTYLVKKITKLSQTLKMKRTKGGFVAQVRPRIDGERTEMSQFAPEPQEALVRLDKFLEKKGLYER